MRQWITIVEGSSVKERNHCRFCNVFSRGGPLVIIELPDNYLRWSEVRQALYRFMKADFGVLQKDVSVEGLAGFTAEDRHLEDLEFLSKIEDAFAGSSQYLKKFNLYRWNNGAFELARAAVTD